MIWSSKSVLPPQNFDAHLFHVLKKTTFSTFERPKSPDVVWKPVWASKKVFGCPKSQHVVWKPANPN